MTELNVLSFAGTGTAPIVLENQEQVGGLAVSAIAGGIVGHMHKYGIDEDFAKQVAMAQPADSCAVFLFGTTEDRDLLLQELSPFHPRLLSTSLEPDEAQRLRNELAEAA